MIREGTKYFLVISKKSIKPRRRLTAQLSDGLCAIPLSLVNTEYFPLTVSVVTLPEAFVSPLCGLFTKINFIYTNQHHNNIVRLWKQSNISPSTLFSTSFGQFGFVPMNIATYVCQNAISSFGKEETKQREWISRTTGYLRWTLILKLW